CRNRDRWKIAGRRWVARCAAPRWRSRFQRSASRSSQSEVGTVSRPIFSAVQGLWAGEAHKLRTSRTEPSRIVQFDSYLVRRGFPQKTLCVSRGQLLVLDETATFFGRSVV